MKPEELPTVYREEVDQDFLLRFLADLDALPGPVEVRLKATARGHTPDGTVSVADAREALLKRRGRGAQFTYEHEGCLWSDTVLVAATHYVVVRMPLPTPGRPGADPAPPGTEDPS